MSEQDVNQTPDQLDEPYVEPAAGQPVQEETPATTETAEATESTAAAATNEQPKLQKTLNLVATILITVAGFCASLFLTLMSYQLVVKAGSESVKGDPIMLADVLKYFEKMGSKPNSATLMTNFFLLLAMAMGIISGIVFGIMLLVKTIQHFGAKKQNDLEKRAITACMFLFAVSVLVLSIVTEQLKMGDESQGYAYGPATLAGLIIVGLLFGAYVVLKVVANIKTYLADKKTTVNFAMNLGWAVLAAIILALLSCAPVAYTSGSATYGFSFVQMIGIGFDGLESSSAAAAEKAVMYIVIGMYGLAIQIWFIFQAIKGLHKAVDGTVSSEKPVALGPQIWRLIFALLYLIACVVADSEVIGNSTSVKAAVAVPVVILLFAVVQLVLAIVSKVLAKKFDNKVAENA